MTRRTVLIGSAVLAVAGYALLWRGYAQRWDWVAAMDAGLLDPLHRFGSAHPAWVTVWDGYCTVVNPEVIRVLLLVVIAYLLVRRRFRVAAFLAVTVETSGLLTELAKALADRPRPSTAFVAAHSTSFPSGHALGLMVIVLALLVLGWPALHRSLRIPLAALGAAVVVSIGVGRVVLNVLHLSDVLAGWALGYAWFVLCLLLIPVIVAAGGTPAAPDSGR